MNSSRDHLLQIRSFSADHQIKIGDAVWIERKEEPKKRRFALPFLRVSDIEKLIQGRCGGPCDTADGSIFYDAVLPELASCARLRGVPLDSGSWAKAHLPAFFNEKGEGYFAERDRAAHDLSHLKNDTIARRLNIRQAEVTGFSLRSLSSVERPTAVRERERKAANRQAEKQCRTLKGAVPREASLSALKPWKTAGVSRATWYRNRSASQPLVLPEAA